MNLPRRIGLWFGCLLLGVGLFSVLFIRVISPGAEVMLIFRITLTFALPVWFLYLPLVVKLRDAEDNRIWILLVSGTLIGPAALTVWGLLCQLLSSGGRDFWPGDPLAPSTAVCLIFASVVGLLTALLYGIALKVLHRRSAVATGRFP